MRLVARQVSHAWTDRGNRVAAVRSFSGELDSRRAHLICGPSGSGKTTLGMILSGLIAPQEGIVTVEELDAASWKRDAAFVFQFPEALFFSDTIEEELQQIVGSNRAAASRWFEALGVPLEKVLDAHPYHLSDGCARLIAVGLQLAREPRILVLDEPSIGLDWVLHERLAHTLSEYASSDRILLVITHDLDLMHALGGAAWVLREGALAWRGSTNSLLSDQDLMTRCALL